MANSRAPLDTMMHQIDLERLKTTNDQYTFESHAESFTIDYAYRMVQHANIMQNHRYIQTRG